MMIRAKICGVSSLEMADVAIDAGASMLGCVHFGKSPRHLSVAKIAALVTHVAGRVPVVAVTVDADDDLLASLIDAGVDMLQLHGDESPERVASIAALGKPVIKAIGVRTVDDLRGLAKFASVAEYVLLDAKAPKGADLPGGNGAPFDWSVLQGADLPENVILSGGLTAANVLEAVRISGLNFVDISSGVESEAGVKSADKINQFMEIIARGI